MTYALLTLVLLIVHPILYSPLRGLWYLAARANVQMFKLDVSLACKVHPAGRPHIGSKLNDFLPVASVARPDQDRVSLADLLCVAHLSHGGLNIHVRRS